MTADNEELDGVCSMLTYDPETGHLFWKRRIRRGMRTRNFDRPAGTRSERGINIKIFGRFYKAHRIAWFLQTGNWPLGVVDHINGDWQDNRWRNLRDITTQQNIWNQRSLIATMQVCSEDA